MLRMNGIEAWITGDDKVAFPEYGVEMDVASSVVTCWIPFEPGKNFAIRWRDLDDVVDVGGFVTIDGHQYGGRLIRSRSHAPAVFSRIATSSTHSRPLSFPLHAPDHTSTPFEGTIALDLYMVVSGGTKIHEGFSDYASQRTCSCTQGPLLTSLLPCSSTEVVSLGKLCTFVFQYRPINFLRHRGIAPTLSFIAPKRESQLGDKRPAITIESHGDDDEGFKRDIISADYARMTRVSISLTSITHMVEEDYRKPKKRRKY